MRKSVGTKQTDPCDYNLGIDFDYKRSLEKRRKALVAPRRNELYMNKLDYYRAKRGDL